MDAHYGHSLGRQPPRVAPNALSALLEQLDPCYPRFRKYLPCPFCEPGDPCVQHGGSRLRRGWRMLKEEGPMRVLQVAINFLLEHAFPGHPWDLGH